MKLRNYSMNVSTQFHEDLLALSKEIFNEKTSSFEHLFVRVKREKTTVKKKKTYFLKKLCCFFI